MDISHIKAVIFDMDGTLVETEHLWAEAKRNVAQTLGVTVTEKVLQQYVGRGLNDFINDLLSPKDQKHRLELNLKMQEHALANYAATLRVINGAPLSCRHLHQPVSRLQFALPVRCKPSR